jgi:heat shock protein beta
MFDKMNSKLENIKLYVRRVFISDSFDDLVPRYLNFIVGVVDSEDLPLNVSREMLQQSRVLKVIKKKLISKALDMIKKLSDREDKAVDKLEEEAGGEKKDKKKKEDDEKQEEEEEEAEEEEEEEGAVKEEPKDTVKNYATFLEQYSKSIKLGIVEDAKNRKKLAKFVRFRSTKTKDGESVSLQRYIDRMAVGQKHVYYITGDDHKELLKSPYLEKLLKRGYEVLVMTDPMDEYMMQHLDEFEDHTFVNVAKEDIKFGDKQEKAEKKRAEKKKEDLKSFIDWYKELLKDNVEKVVISNRLTDTPLAVVSGQYGYTAHMERLMKAQALADPSRYQFMSSKKTVEINPFHPLIVDLAARVEKDKEDESIKVVAQTLFDAALVQGDFELVDKTRFTQSVVSLLNDKVRGKGVSWRCLVDARVFMLRMVCCYVMVTFCAAGVGRICQSGDSRAHRRG